MMQSQWLQKRNYFNHHWLKNQFLLYLDDLLMQCSDNDIPLSELKTDLQDISAAWAEKYNDITWLVDNFEREMSPAVYLSWPPLNRLDTAASEMVRETVYLLWQSRVGSSQLLADLKKVIRDTDDKIRQFGDLVEVLPGVDKAAIRAALSSLKNQFNLLSNSLGRFPSSIEIA